MPQAVTVHTQGQAGKQLRRTRLPTSMQGSSSQACPESGLKTTRVMRIKTAAPGPHQHTQADNDQKALGSPSGEVMRRRRLRLQPSSAILPCTRNCRLEARTGFWGLPVRCLPGKLSSWLPRSSMAASCMSLTVRCLCLHTQEHAWLDHSQHWPVVCGGATCHRNPSPGICHHRVTGL